MKLKTTLRFLPLRRHFRVRTVTALQWPWSELPLVTGKLEVLLYVYRVISVVTGPVN